MAFASVDSSVCGCTHHMLVSVYGSRWQEVELAMMTVYVDDSGTDPKQSNAIATGMIVPAVEIIRLENAWDELKREEGFTDFHTSEFVFKNPKSDFANWDDVKHKRVFERVRNIIKKYGLKAASVAVRKQDYLDVLPESFRNLIGGYHYTWAVHHLLSFLRTTRLQRHPGCYGFEYVFDWMEFNSDERIEVEAAMARAEEVAIEDGMTGEFTNSSFRRHQAVPGLQCVDCVCWTAYQFARFAFDKVPMHPFAEIAWKDFDGPLEQDGWLGAITIKREHLEEWYAKVITDPKNLDQYRRAEQNRLVKQKAPRKK
jgi:hypothetical protein